MKTKEWFRDRIGKTVKRLRINNSGVVVASYYIIKNKTDANKYFKQQPEYQFKDNTPKLSDNYKPNKHRPHASFTQT